MPTIENRLQKWDKNRHLPLDLSCLDIGPQEIVTVLIYLALSSPYSLSSLDLHGNRLTDEGVILLAQGFRHFPRLKVLNLENNQLSVLSIRALLDAWQFLVTSTEQSGSKQQDSRSTSNNFENESKVSQLNQESITTINHRACSLQSLRLGCNFLGDDGVEALLPALGTTLAGLEILDLSYSQVTASGFLLLTQRLHAVSSASLRMLSLPGNNIGDNGVTAFLELKDRYPNLQCDLRWNSINNAVINQNLLKTAEYQKIDVRYNPDSFSWSLTAPAVVDLSAKQIFPVGMENPKEIFQSQIQMMITDWFLGCRMLRSGLIQGQWVKTPSLTVVRYLGIGADYFVPFAGRIVNLLTIGVQEYYSRAPERRQNDMLSRVVRIDDIECLASEFAKDLADRYEYQINKLTPKGAEMLAQSAVQRIMAAIQKGKIISKQPLRAQFFSAVSMLPSISKKSIPTRDLSKTWSDEGVFIRSGIKVVEEGTVLKFIGEKYCNRPNKYGYRIGTRDEAVKELGLKLEP